MNNLCLCLALVIASAFSGERARAQSNSGSQEIEKTIINKTLVLDSTNPRHNADSFYHTAKIGSFPSGAEVSAVLEVKNKFESAIEFDHAKASCTCETLKLAGATIPPGKAVFAKLDFTIGNGDSDSGLHSASFTLYRAGMEVGVITLQCDVTEQLHFLANHQQVMDVGDSVVECRIPLKYSAPIQVKNLEVSIDKGSFESLEVQTDIEPTGSDRCLVTLSTYAGDMENSSSTGIVRVTDTVSGRTTETSILLHKASPVEIVPREILLSKSEEDDDVLEGTALIRVSTLTESQDEEGAKEDSGVEPKKPAGVKVSAKLISGEDIKLENKQIGTKIVRSKLYLNSKKVKTGAKVAWEIEANGQTYQLVTEVNR